MFVASIFFMFDGFVCFFFNDTATTEIYTLSLHDVFRSPFRDPGGGRSVPPALSVRARRSVRSDRKSTRLNSSHVEISYAVFCLKKKKYDDSMFPPETLAYV